jgi:hypothetical protein
MSQSCHGAEGREMGAYITPRDIGSVPLKCEATRRTLRTRTAGKCFWILQSVTKGRPKNWRQERAGQVANSVGVLQLPFARTL